MGIAYHRLARSLIQLSKRLDPQKLKTIVGSRPECLCGNQLNRYQWCRQGGPWLWCPCCDWAGDAIDLLVARAGADSRQGYRVFGLAVDEQAEAARAVISRYRRIVTAVTSSRAGADWSTVARQLLRCHDVGLNCGDNRPYGPVIGCASSDWLASEGLRVIGGKEDFRHVVVPLEAVPGLYTGLAVLQTRTDSYSDFGSLIGLLQETEDGRNCYGWVGLSTIARNPQLWSPIFLENKDWLKWSLEDLGRRRRRPALARVSRNFDKCTASARQLSGWFKSVVVARLGSPQYRTAQGLGLRVCHSLLRRWSETDIDLAIASAEPGEQRIEAYDSRKFGWHPGIGFKLSGLLVTTTGCVPVARLRGMRSLHYDTAQAILAVRSANLATLTVSALFCVNAASQVFGVSAKCCQLVGKAGQARKLLSLLGAQVVKTNLDKSKGYAGRLATRAISGIPIAVIAGKRYSARGKFAAAVVSGIHNGVGALYISKHPKVAEFLCVECRWLRKIPAELNCVLPAFLQWLMDEVGTVRPQSWDSLLKLFLRWLRASGAAARDVRRKLIRDNPGKLQLQVGRKKTKHSEE